MDPREQIGRTEMITVCGNAYDATLTTVREVSGGRTECDYHVVRPDSIGTAAISLAYGPGLTRRSADANTQRLAGALEAID